MNVDLENRIREWAYSLWEREGKPQGKHLEHWLRAKSEIEVKFEPRKVAGKQPRASAPARYSPKKRPKS